MPELGGYQGHIVGGSSVGGSPQQFFVRDNGNGRLDTSDRVTNFRPDELSPWEYPFDNPQVIRNSRTGEVGVQWRDNFYPQAGPAQENILPPPTRQSSQPTAGGNNSTAATTASTLPVLNDQPGTIVGDDQSRQFFVPDTNGNGQLDLGDNGSRPTNMRDNASSDWEYTAGQPVLAELNGEVGVRHGRTFYPQDGKPVQLSSSPQASGATVTPQNPDTITKPRNPVSQAVTNFGNGFQNPDPADSVSGNPAYGAGQVTRRLADTAGNVISLPFALGGCEAQPERNCAAEFPQGGQPYSQCIQEKNGGGGSGTGGGLNERVDGILDEGGLQRPQGNGAPRTLDEWGRGMKDNVDNRRQINEQLGGSGGGSGQTTQNPVTGEICTFTGASSRSGADNYACPSGGNVVDTLDGSRVVKDSQGNVIHRE
ncbi:MAG: hypothetical protein SFZ03_01515 [Candidatus Melainabacteria bacterium]|nr:hypothetical protein [Candidatus Melainabacteria bacterium]